MSNRSASRMRGSRAAIAIALTLVGLFCVGEYVSHWKRPGYYHAPRTTTLSVRARPGKAIKISAEPLPMVPEPPVEWLDRSMWSAYKSDAPNTLAMIEPPAGVKLSAPVSIELPDPFTDERSSSRVALSPTELRDSISASAVSTSTPIVSRPVNSDMGSDPWGKNWPEPMQLLNEVVHLQGLPLGESNADIRDWLSKIQYTVNEMRSQAIGSDSSALIVEELRNLVDRGYELSSQFTTDIEAARDVSRISYSLERRHAVWTSVQQCVQSRNGAYIAPRSYSIDSERMAAQLEVARTALARTEDKAGWNTYLILDRIEDLAKGRIGSKDEQVSVARDFLTRVTNTRVSAEQLKVLRSAPIHRLADQIHPLTIKPVDYRKLILDLETVECNPVHRCSEDLADAIQSLRFSEHPELGAIAAAINTHYRNANVRLSVSESFLNRMMPRNQVTSRPVQQRILGADTRGASQVQTNLKVDLLPDPSAWKLQLKLDGQIDSSTQSSRNGATFFNSTNAHVQSQRELRIDAQSLSINGSPASVESSDALRRFSTNWDSMPIVGDMIRYIAHQEFSQSRPVAKRITQRLIAQQTDEEFDKQLRTQIGSAQESLESRFLGPLQSLQLSPLVMDMQSTEDRLIARYRLANPRQLSAFTPRPLAPGDSQLSIQIHHSIFNNLVDQAIDTQRDWTIQQLSDSIADILQQPRPTLPADTPHDVTLRFSDPNPLSIEFDDGRMWLTLRIDSLEQPGRIQLKNFTIRTSYTATVDGLQAELLRDGIISIDGHRLGSRDRLPLRAIFTKVFSNRSSIPMVAQNLLDDPRAQGLVVTQFDMRDGWLAIAVSDRSAKHIAGSNKSFDSLR